MALGMEVGLGPGHSVLDGELATLPKKGADPQFLAHFYCRQTAGCIKMPLRVEVDLSPGDFVLDGYPAPSPKRGRSPLPIFGPCLLWPNGCMDQDATWYGGGFVLHGDPAPLSIFGRVAGSPSKRGRP